MAERELLAVPMTAAPGGALDLQSGIARMAGVLWCTRWRATPGKLSKVVLIFVHPSSSFMGHYALSTMAELGVDAVGMSTRYMNNESTLLLENCVLDIGFVIRHLKSEGYERVVLVGNSGGGSLVPLYQSEAEHPSITAPPGGGAPDLTKASLPTADGLILLMAHPGRSIVLTEKLDPAIRDEADPFDRDPELDMFDPANGPPYSAEFLTRFRAAQIARNERITDWAIARLEEVMKRTNGKVHDLPFVVHGTVADPRNLDLSLDPSDRKATTHWGEPFTANFIPASLGHYTSLRSWLSQWSNRCSNGNGPACLKRVSVPIHVIYGTADPGCYPSYAQQFFDAIPHDRKKLTAVKGGNHYLTGQPEQKQFACQLMADWSRALT
ncbi:lysophospholipase [Bradyrhizobium sp. KBS0727]|uniref:alpha/beta fold hydrolase n=1 Tax=unclassified Bradyrhizobium TaxID=2631580 RepID=UPI00110DA204|nr:MULTISPECIES: alpha/beta fold hydrolase [unclassified Bradyrhizobium]QDW36897.1 lysophospholipase [Bradyrhizobium sp. KBS0725]QDW43497.1 lysophospholipase [Bradyrhizobium sp. KBS0727]